MENKLTVVIPTLQKNKEILSEVINSLDKDDSVTEIILIDNSLLGFSHSSKKLTVITPKENLYVNPAWNLGVELAKTDIVALLNDDLILPNNYCGDVASLINSDMGIVGVNGLGVEALPNIFKIPPKEKIYLEPTNFMDDCFGIAMFFHKNAYKKIPDEIKIVYGDSWIFTSCQRAKRQNYRICGCTIYHYGSLTSGRMEFNPIAKNDSKIYKKLTVKWYHRLYSYEEIWDCHKYRILGITLKINKKNPWGKRHNA